MDKIIQELTKKYSISKSKLLNSGGGSAKEFACRIKELEEELQTKHKTNPEIFEKYFEEYIKS